MGSAVTVQHPATDEVASDVDAEDVGNIIDDVIEELHNIQETLLAIPDDERRKEASEGFYRHLVSWKPRQKCMAITAKGTPCKQLAERNGLCSKNHGGLKSSVKEMSSVPSRIKSMDHEFHVPRDDDIKFFVRQAIRACLPLNESKCSSVYCRQVSWKEEKLNLYKIGISESGRPITLNREWKLEAVDAGSTMFSGRGCVVVENFLHKVLSSDYAMDREVMRNLTKSGGGFTEYYVIGNAKTHVKELIRKFWNIAEGMVLGDYGYATKSRIRETRMENMTKLLNTPEVKELLKR